MLKLWWKEWQRKRLLAMTKSDVMKEYLSVPFPVASSCVDELDIMAIDFETTGLDKKNNSIVSTGCVCLKERAVLLSSACQQFVQVDVTLPESSVIVHGITDSQLENEAVSLGEAVVKLLQLLRGKVLLAHNASIEIGFLDQACKQLYGTGFVIPVIDTLFLAQRSFRRQGRMPEKNALRLFNLRREYGLPVYRAHDALMDAVATAELFLAMCSHLSPTRPLQLKDLL